MKDEVQNTLKSDQGPTKHTTWLLSHTFVCRRILPHLIPVINKNFPFQICISSDDLEGIWLCVFCTWAACQPDLIGGGGKRSGRGRERGMNRGDRRRADRQGGETESRWPSWHLSYTKICLEPFSTCLFKKRANSAYYAKKKHTHTLSQVLTLCDQAFPELLTHNGMAPVWTGWDTKTPSNPSTLSHPRLVSKQRGHSEQERVSFKALICGPHAAQQPRTWTSSTVTDLTTHTHTEPGLPGLNMACIWQVRKSVPGGCIYKLRSAWSLSGPLHQHHTDTLTSLFVANCNYLTSRLRKTPTFPPVFFFCCCRC